MSLKCHVVKDLLPNYIDKLTSEETNKEISSHLDKCSECKKQYNEMTGQIPELDLKIKDSNIQEVNYLKKYSNQTKKIIIILGIIMLVFITIIVLFFISWVEKDKTTNIAKYNEYLGINSKYEDKNLIYNDIFPDTIPKSAEVEDFYFYYYNPWDPNYLSYLVYTCSDADYEKEKNRLKALDSAEDYLIYGATEFPYPVCAVYADRYFGYIYAMADKEHNRLIYIELTFCNNFTDINYQKIVDKDYLPIGFDAKNGNATQKAFVNVGNID
ncbi:MAG: zf-HC2 domain-containing protein [Clostridiaceae bacterium]